MPGYDFNQLGTVARALPSARTLDQRTPIPNVRVGSYLEQYVIPLGYSMHSYADEGTYFSATSVPGTTIAYGSAGTQASFSDTVPFISVQNTDATNGKRISLHRLKLIQIGGTAPATTTSVQMAIKVDNISRQNTAGTMTSITPSCTNMGSSAASITRYWLPSGAVATIPASSGSARTVARGQVKGGPTLVLDEYNVTFGGPDHPAPILYSTAVSSYYTDLPPVQIDPGQWGVIYLWFPGGATNPFTFEWQMSHWER